MQATLQSPGPDTEIIKHVIKLQILLVVISIITIKWVLPAAMKSVLYGGCVAILNSGFLYWRMRQACLTQATTAAQSLKQVQRAGLERFLLVGVMLAAGMLGKLKLLPVTVLLSFIIGQLVFLLVVALSPGRAK